MSLIKKVTSHAQRTHQIINSFVALDQIITSMMENASSTRPVPATESIIDALPREVLELGCTVLHKLMSPSPCSLNYPVASKLDKDCAVCKEQFNVETEDPDEQVVVTLPCTHVFHEGCIIPWLKSSGTCPVCR